MKIQVGKTYVGKDGKTERTVVRLYRNLSPEARHHWLQYRKPADIYEYECFIPTFVRWAKSEVPEP